MDIELKVDKIYSTPKIVIYTNEITQEISSTIDRLTNIAHNKLNVYKDEKMYILNQNEIETIYS